MTTVTANKKIFMMCEPTNYGIWDPDPKKGFANKFQEAGHKAFNKDPKGYVQANLEDWHRIKETIETKAEVVLLPTMENTDTIKYYDQVFTADASLSMKTNHGLVTLRSRFTNTERNPEIDLHEAFILATDKARGIEGRIIKATPFNIEGTGDNVYDPYRDMFWSGYTVNTDRANASEGRSDKRAHAHLKAATGTKVNSMETKEGFFHQDTSLSPLPRGEIVFYPGGVDKKHLKKFNRVAFDKFGLSAKTHLIEIDAAEADAYACNQLYIGDNTIIVTNATSASYQDKLKRAGYDVIPLPAEKLRESGGAFHCITNPIYEDKIDGGYHGMRLEAR